MPLSLRKLIICLGAALKLVGGDDVCGGDVCLVVMLLSVLDPVMMVWVTMRRVMMLWVLMRWCDEGVDDDDAGADDAGGDVVGDDDDGAQVGDFGDGDDAKGGWPHWIGRGYLTVGVSGKPGGQHRYFTYRLGAVSPGGGGV